MAARVPGGADERGREAGLEAEDRLRVELRHARLGHAEHLADLAQGQLLVVVERDDELLALGQPRDRVARAPRAAPCAPCASCGSGAWGSSSVSMQRDRVAAARRARPQLVERGDRRPRDLEQRLLELLLGDRRARRRSPRRSGRAPACASSSAIARSMSRARARTERGTQSIERSSSMIDALDPRDRVRLELDVALGVEALDRADQAEQPVGDEVALVDVRRQPAAEPAGDVLDERRVGEDQPVARGLVAGALVLAPEGLGVVWPLDHVERIEGRAARELRQFSYLSSLYGQLAHPDGDEDRRGRDHPRGAAGLGGPITREQEAEPRGRRRALRGASVAHPGTNAFSPEGRSSTGRAPVSKTGGSQVRVLPALSLVVSRKPA